MDQGGGGDGGDRIGFHRNEAISAVQDEEQFYGEDEDYEDLYNDVNVGEGFFQSVPRSEDPGSFHREDEPRIDAQPPPPPQRQPPAAVDLPDKIQIPGIAGEPKLEKPTSGFPEPVPVPARPPPPPAVVRPDLGQPSGGPGFNNDGFHRQGGNFGNESFQRQNVGVNGAANAGVAVAAGGGGGGTTTLFVGDLHWWTTDADIEAELVKYGPVKEVKFFDEKASGKSKGYCQVDFYDPAAATACKEGMNGHLFNGRPCIVAFSSPYGVRRMGEAQVSRNQQTMGQSQSQPTMVQKGRGGGGGAQMGGGNYGRGGGGGGGGGNWGRGGGMGNRGPMGNMRNRMGPVGGRGIMGNGGMVAPPPPVLHPGTMLGQGFDPTGYGAAAMGRMGGGYGGFPAGPGGGPFPGMMPTFQPVVAPHVNPAFFGRGMPGGAVGMWPDPNMGGWGGEEQSSYGEDAGSDQQYGEGGTHGKERVAERGPDRDWAGGSERRQHEREKDVSGGEWSEKRHREDREMVRDRDRDWERDRDRDRERERERDRERDRERERDRYRDERDRHGDHYRHREREVERDDDWDRGRSRGRSHSRDVENVKRRRGSE